jgi:organic radical activating enzyme
MHSSLDVSWGPRGWQAKPCCLSSSDHLGTQLGPRLQQKDWFHSLWPDLREDNLADKALDPMLCGACVDDECVGKQSRRVGELIRRGARLQSPVVGPRYLEIAMDMTCNSACMICGNARSSFWKRYSDRPRDLTRASQGDIDQLLENLDLSQLDHMNIAGGEPLLTDRHITLLRTLERRGVDLGKIQLRYNTNGTCRVDDEVLELWSKFRQVILYFSLDDTGEAFNYQRFPGDWNTVTENMWWFRDHLSPNVLMRVERTVSLLNAHRLKFLDQWVRDDFPFNGFDQRVEVQTHMAEGVLGIENISGRHLESIKADPEAHALLSKMYPVGDIRHTDRDNARVLNLVDTQDQRRGMAIGSYFPEFRSYYI